MSDERWTAALRAIAEPIAAEHDAEIYDIERLGATVRLSITRPGGIDLETITAINRAVSHEIDEQDPIPGAFTLEVSSPGLERRLRTPEHWAGAVGEQVKVKLTVELDGQRRVEGAVAGIDDQLVSLVAADGATATFSLDLVDTAKTHFDWGNPPKPTVAKPTGAKPPVAKAGASHPGAAADTNSESINKDGHDER